MPFPVGYFRLQKGSQRVEDVGQRLTDLADVEHCQNQRSQHNALLFGQGSPVVDRLRKPRFSSEPE
jgi:hypothetical protein